MTTETSKSPMTLGTEPVIAFCTLIAVGGATISSIFMGQKDISRATDVVNNVLLLCIIQSVVFGGITLLFLDEILYFFGATPGTIGYAREFMEVILLGTPIAYVFIGLNNLMRATGYPRKAMVSALLSVGVNVIMAPIFIFKLGWGIRGAALATVIGQSAACIWVVAHFLSRRSFIHFNIRNRWFTPSIARRIIAMGMSPFLMSVCACIVVVFINKALLDYAGDAGDLSVGAYGILNRTTMFFVMIACGDLAGVGITTAGWIVTQLFPDAVSSLFTTDRQLIEIAGHGARIYFLFFPVVGCQIVIQNYFQSVGKPKISIFLSLTRQLIFLIPFLIILPHFYGIDGVWSSIAASDMIAFLFAIVTLWWQMRKHDKAIPTT